MKLNIVDIEEILYEKKHDFNCNANDLIKKSHYNKKIKKNEKQRFKRTKLFD